jgi:hypothetical protein
MVWQPILRRALKIALYLVPGLRHVHPRDGSGRGVRPRANFHAQDHGGQGLPKHKQNSLDGSGNLHQEGVIAAADKDESIFLKKSECWFEQACWAMTEG